MKFNWGTGIVIFFLLFATSMTLAVVATTRHPPQLMQSDYYALDLAYQERLEKKLNAAGLAVPPTITFDAAKKALLVQLPAGMPAQSGTVHCYRSATTRDDLSTPFTHVSEIRIAANDFLPGRWHVELDWVAEGKKYFWETVLVK